MYLKLNTFHISMFCITILYVYLLFMFLPYKVKYYLKTELYVSFKAYRILISMQRTSARSFLLDSNYKKCLCLCHF